MYVRSFLALDTSQNVTLLFGKKLVIFCLFFWIWEIWQVWKKESLDRTPPEEGGMSGYLDSGKVSWGGSRWFEKRAWESNYLNITFKKEIEEQKSISTINVLQIYGKKLGVQYITSDIRRVCILSSLAEPKLLCWLLRFALWKGLWNSTLS